MRYYGTLGPACADRRTLHEMLDRGMTGIRLNLSHSRLTERQDWVQAYLDAAAEAGVLPDLLIDLQGPELRIGMLPEEGLPLPLGGTALLGEGGIPVPALMLRHLRPGMEVKIDDGALLLRVLSARDTRAECLVLRGGALHARKSVTVVDTYIPMPTLTEEDEENLRLARQMGVAGVMLSFVRDASDLITLRDTLQENGAGDLRVLAKIESREGILTLGDTMPFADEFVIARGDLGMNLPLWEVPQAQKEAAKLLNACGKPFMVVTQLLHSMHESPVPTRAEVSDIFNAVLDGASSLMLTGETAVGRYPAEAMQTLVQTAEAALAWRTQHR